MDTTPIKVCDIVQSYSAISGGVKRYVHDKMTYAERTGNLQQRLIVPAAKDGERKVGATIIYEVGSPPLPGSKSYRLLLDRSHMLRVIRQEQPDVLEVGNPYWPAWVALEAGKELGRPVVAFYHSDFPRSIGRLMGERTGLEAPDQWLTGLLEGYLGNLYKRMDAVASATQRYAKVLQQMGVKQVVRTPLGTDTQTFKPPENPQDNRRRVLQELAIPEEAFVILYVGRFAEMKNLEQLVAMMDHLEPGARPYCLVLAGDGEKREGVEKAARGRDNVLLRGYMDDQKELVRLYAGADLFMNASTYETFGLVSLEAQACGTRVIGVRGGGMDESLEGEEPLILADSEEPQDLARAVDQASQLEEYANAQAGAAIARRRRRRIERYFSLEACFDRMTALYRHLRQGGRAVDFPAPEKPQQAE